MKNKEVRSNQNMCIPNKRYLLIILIVMGIHSETTVLTDEKFPYRVVCNSEWIQQEKNDTMLIIRNTASGKKTRLQLKKYAVDSNFNWNTKEWSRWRFVINSDMIIQLGKIGFVDTSATKKLGGYRAYEIFAFFWEKTDDETLWLAEYIRWTDNNGTGYMASIIGDTLDMKDNIKNKNYVCLIDSISLSFFQTGNVVEKNSVTNISIKKNDNISPVWYDLLGRNLNDFHYSKPDKIIVKKDTKNISLKLKMN